MRPITPEAEEIINNILDFIPDITTTAGKHKLTTGIIRALNYFEALEQDNVSRKLIELLNDMYSSGSDEEDEFSAIYTLEEVYDNINKHGFYECSGCGVIYLRTMRKVNTHKRNNFCPACSAGKVSKKLHVRRKRAQERN